MKYLAWFLGSVFVVCLSFVVWAQVRERYEARALVPESGRFIRAHDVELFVQTRGDEKNPPVVLLHGMAAWSGTWERTSQALVDAGWYVIAVDMPPFGFSERPSDRSYWRVSQAERLAALFDAIALKAPLVVAHSYGSRAAFELVMRTPEKVGGLVVVDPALDGIYDDAPVSGSVPLPLRFAPLRYVLVSMTMTNPLLSGKLLELFMYKKEAATDEVVALYQKPAGIRGSTHDLGFWVAGFLGGEDKGKSSERSRYAELTVPVGIIWGREDTTTPLVQGEKLHTYIPHSQLSIIDGVGHMPHIEDTDAFHAVLLPLLTDLNSRTGVR